MSNAADNGRLRHRNCQFEEMLETKPPKRRNGDRQMAKTCETPTGNDPEERFTIVVIRGTVVANGPLADYENQGFLDQLRNAPLLAVANVNSSTNQTGLTPDEVEELRDLFAQMGELFHPEPLPTLNGNDPEAVRAWAC